MAIRSEPWPNCSPPPFNRCAAQRMHLSAPPPPASRASAPLLLAALVLVFILGVGWVVHGQRQAEAGHAALQALETRTEQLHHLDSLLLQVLEAESGARAYALAGDERYLTAYVGGRDQGAATLAALRTAFAADATASSALDPLEETVARRWEGLDRLVASRGTGVAVESAIIAGSRITDEIRARILALRAPLAERKDEIILGSFERSAQARSINTVLGVALILMLLVIGILVHRQDALRRRITDLLRSENVRLQAEVDARTAELVSLAGYLSETREAEQARLATELHDEFGPLLSAVRMDAVWITRKLPLEVLEPLRARFDHLLDTLGRVVSTKRRIVAGLKPPLLADLGLAEALRSLVAEIGTAEGPQIVLDLPDDLPPLPKPAALALYRIAQEAIDNARRHASAHWIGVAVTATAAEMVIRVEDDGIGFDPARVRARGHGLAGLALRVKMIGGELDIDSAPGRGSRIEARVPLPTES